MRTNNDGIDILRHTLHALHQTHHHPLLRTLQLHAPSLPLYRVGIQRTNY